MRNDFWLELNLTFQNIDGANSSTLYRLMINTSNGAQKRPEECKPPQKRTWKLWPNSKLEPTTDQRLPAAKKAQVCEYG